jgi:hypothetical protein
LEKDRRVVKGVDYLVKIIRTDYIPLSTKLRLQQSLGEASSFPTLSLLYGKAKWGVWLELGGGRLRVKPKGNPWHQLLYQHILASRTCTISGS